MSTHDYNVANQNGGSTRSDLNNLFAAILSNNSSATAPTTTSAYMWWCDTANDLLKQRDSSNASWVTKGTLSGTYFGLLALSGGTMTGALLAAAGSLSACGIAFTGDVNTGIYSSGADAMGFVAAGVEYLRISTSGGDFLGTGAVKVPVGTTAQRPTAATGKIRYNSTLGEFEGYAASAWGPLTRYAPAISSKTANYTTLDTDSVIYVDGTSGAFAITLHTPTYNQSLNLIRTDNTIANAVSITGTVSGETNWKLHTKNESYQLQYSTSLAAWRVLNHRTDTDEVDAGTITITATSSNPTKSGTKHIDKVIWYRDGAFAYITYAYGHSVAGSAGSGDYLYALPTGMAFSNASMSYSTGAIGSAMYSQSQVDTTSSLFYISSGPTSNQVGPAVAYDSTKFRIMIGNIASGLFQTSSNIPFSLNSLGYKFTIKIQVDGWKP